MDDRPSPASDPTKTTLSQAQPAHTYQHEPAAAKSDGNGDGAAERRRKDFHTSAQRARQLSPPSPEADGKRIPPRRCRSSRDSQGSLNHPRFSPGGNGGRARRGSAHDSATQWRPSEDGGGGSRRSSMPLMYTGLETAEDRGGNGDGGLGGVPGDETAAYAAAAAAACEEIRWTRRRSSDGAAAVLEFHRNSRRPSMGLPPSSLGGSSTADYAGHGGRSGSGESLSIPDERTPTGSPALRRTSYTSALSVHTPVPSHDSSMEVREAEHMPTSPSTPASGALDDVAFLGAASPLQPALSPTSEEQAQVLAATVALGHAPPPSWLAPPTGVGQQGAVPARTWAGVVAGAAVAAAEDGANLPLALDSQGSAAIAPSHGQQHQQPPSAHSQRPVLLETREQQTEEEEVTDHSPRSSLPTGGSSDGHDGDSEASASVASSAASFASHSPRSFPSSPSLGHIPHRAHDAGQPGKHASPAETPTAIGQAFVYPDEQLDPSKGSELRQWHVGGDETTTHRRQNAPHHPDDGLPAPSATDVSPRASMEGGDTAVPSQQSSIDRQSSGSIVQRSSRPSLEKARSSSMPQPLLKHHPTSLEVTLTATDSDMEMTASPEVERRTLRRAPALAYDDHVNDSESSGSSGHAGAGSVQQARFFEASCESPDTGASVADKRLASEDRRVSLELPPFNQRSRDRGFSASSGFSSDSSISSSLMEMPEVVCLRPATPGKGINFRSVRDPDPDLMEALESVATSTSTAPASVLSSPMSAASGAFSWRGAAMGRRHHGPLTTTKSADGGWLDEGHRAGDDASELARRQSGTAASPLQTSAAQATTAAAADGGSVGSVERRRSSCDVDQFASSDESSATASVASSRRGSRTVREKWIHALRLYRAIRIFKRKGYPWVQLAGHAEGFKKDVDPNWILKLGSENERAILEMLQREPKIAPFVPKYGGMVESDGKRYLKMQNLVARFPNTCVMDIKMGLRTFVESEVNATALRKDLLKKLLDIDPEAATPAEVQNGITKMRYMQFRERQSSSYALGFRLEAMRVGQRANKGFKTLRARSDIIRNVEFYLDGKADVKQVFLERLQNLCQALQESAFFHKHEIIGSSLLFLYDSVTQDAGVWMIDFAKTTLHDDCYIHHDQPWQAGQNSFEDGYLTGLNKLIEVFQSCKV